MTNQSLHLLYVDDSGAESTGWVLYSWIEIRAHQWRVGLRHWLDLRKDLYAKYRIPPGYELHATKFASGRGNPSTDLAFNQSKELRREVMEAGLDAIRHSGALRVGTFYRQTTARGKDYHLERQSLYADMIARLDTEMVTGNDLGIVFMDGDGTDRGYNNAHRALKLNTRAIIEDPMFMSSGSSQWIQMADLAAWTAYQGLQRHSGKQWAWDWYDTSLTGCDLNGGPVGI